MIKAEIVADSINEFGNRITTMLVTMPRIILAEFNTHRMFSRNTSSSRAIPFKKMVKAIKENPFVPIAWQKDHPGMQGTEYYSKEEKFNLNTFISAMVTNLNTLEKENKNYEKLNQEIIERVELIESILQPYIFAEKTLDEWWLFARDKAIETACIMYVFKATKQLCNRLLEPFMWTTVLVTATEWENFFALRCPTYELELENGDNGKRSIKTRSKKDFLKDFLNIYPTHGQKELVEDYLLVDNLDNMIPNNNIGWFKLNKGQAEIHMMALAEAMWDAYNESTPNKLSAGEWHIPFKEKIKLTENWDENLEKYLKAIQNGEDEESLKIAMTAIEIEISTVMCARTSYTVVGEDQKPLSYERMIEIHYELLAANPKHMSPFEHCAQAMDSFTRYEGKFVGAPANKYTGWSGNFQGFIQYRKTLPNENITLNK